MFRIRWTWHRCTHASGKLSRTAFRNPLFPSMMANNGSASPRCFMS
jgi:hypothetical protein